MTRSRLAAIALSSALLFVRCDSATGSDVSPRSVLHFRAAYRGALSRTSEVDVFRETIRGTGSATALGKSRLRSTDLVGPDAPLHMGRGRLSAAGGDTLSYTYTFPQTHVASSVEVRTGRFSITGGTGRFQGARGRGLYTDRQTLRPGIGSAGTWPITIHFSGTLRLAH